MGLEEVILLLPVAGLPTSVFFMPRLFSGFGMPAALSLFIAAIGALSFGAALFLSDTIFPPQGGVDCGFCKALSEMIAASLLLSAIGLGSILVWNLRKLEFTS